MKFARIFFLNFIFGFLFSALHSSFALAVPAEAEPPLADERVIFHTNFGDIVVGLFPSVAPKTVSQILKMVAAGVYTDTSIFRIEPGFVAQVANFDTRTIPLSTTERAAVEKIPGEFNSVPHRRGILSMARYDNPDSGEASFSFLLGPAPHLDHKYTVFGRVVEGMDVLTAMENVSVNEHFDPLTEVTIKSAEVVSATQVSQMRLVPVQHPEAVEERSKVYFEIFAAILFAFTVALPIVKTVLIKPIKT